MPLHDLPILFAALAFALMGIGALANPLLVTRQFGIRELTPAGRNEIRAVYGGFGLAMAGVLVIALQAPDLRPGICLTTALALTGMAIGRLVSALADRRLDAMPIVYMALEVLFAGLIIHAA